MNWQKNLSKKNKYLIKLFSIAVLLGIFLSFTFKSTSAGVFIHYLRISDIQSGGVNQNILQSRTHDSGDIYRINTSSDDPSQTPDSELANQLINSPLLISRLMNRSGMTLDNSVVGNLSFHENTTQTISIPVTPALNYLLKTWTPELTNELITYLNHYPETLSKSERGYHDGGYYGSFVYAALVQQESLLRFPNSVYAMEWRWGLAYNLALSGYKNIGISASEIYADLIHTALNSHVTKTNNLSEWFSSKEPRLRLKVIDLPLSSKLMESKLLEISPVPPAEFEASWSPFNGAYLWLVSDSSGLRVYPLKNRDDFGYTSEAGLSYEIIDVNGDNIPEIITQHDHQHGVGSSFNDALIDVFEIKDIPPSKLIFDPPLPTTGHINFKVSEGIDNKPIIMIENYTWETCPGPISYYYRSNGNMLKLSKIEIQLTENFFQYPDCILESGAALEIEAKKGYGNSRELLYTWMNALPTQIDSSNRFTDNWPEYRDQIRYKVGLLMASWDELDLSRKIMQDLEYNPSYENSSWIKPAGIFIKTVKISSDLPHTCDGLIPCYPYLDLRTLLEFSRLENQTSPFSYLQRSGMVIKSGGLLGIVDKDSKLYWLVDDKGSIYLIINSNKEYSVNLLRTKPIAIPTMKIFNFSQHPDFSGMPYYYFYYDAYEANFIFYKRNSDQSYILSYPEDYISDTIQESEVQLLTGGEPQKEANRLQNLKYPGLLPNRSDPYLTFLSQQYLYFQALAYELSGDDFQAVQTYLTLSRDYPQSPFEYIAFSKLEPIR